MRWWRRLTAQIGDHEVDDARRLADLERAAGSTPLGCAWLDDRTVEDLDLGAVYRSIDRTHTAIGAQVLWRWLVAPAHDLDVLARRERELETFRDAGLRERVCGALGTTTIADAPHVTRLLWDEPAAPLRAVLIPALWAALIGFIALAHWWPFAAIGALLVFAANIVIDDWSKLRLAHQTRALEVLDDLLSRAAALARVVPAGDIATDLEVRHALHRRMMVNRVRDPFDLFDLLRAGTLIRLGVTRSAMLLVVAERERLRRIVLWVGEVDALVAVATLRTERAQLRVPELAPSETTIHAGELAHPSIANAIGNDFELAAGLLVTGSNASGKSTFLRTIAVNAILAQSIHTTLGTWRGPPLRVRCVMRIADDPANGMSTYAVEVAAVKVLVTGTLDGMKSLFLVDEPFNGTNPTIRVPIVVAVLEYLAGTGLVVAATHDLDVATRLDARFDRVYFEERADGTFDRRLHTGIAPATNAIELLRRADYPAAILDRLN